MRSPTHLMIVDVAIALLCVACTGLDNLDLGPPPSPPGPLITGTGIAGYRATLYQGLPFPVHDFGGVGTGKTLIGAGICLFTSLDYIYTQDIYPVGFFGSVDHARMYGTFTAPLADSLVFTGSLGAAGTSVGDTLRIVDGPKYLFVRDSAYAWNTCGILNATGASQYAHP